MPFSTTVPLEFAEQAEDPGQGFNFNQLATLASWQAGLQQTGGFASCINVHVALLLPNCAELSRPFFALAVSGIPPKKPVYVAYVCVSRLCHSLCWLLRLSEDVSSLE